MHVIEFVGEAGHPVYIVASKIVSFQASALPGTRDGTLLSLEGGFTLAVRESVHQVRMLLKATEALSEAQG